MNTLIDFAIKEAHDLNSPMSEQTRKDWLKLEQKRKELLEKRETSEDKWRADAYVDQKCEQEKTELANCSYTI